MLAQFGGAALLLKVKGGNETVANCRNSYITNTSPASRGGCLRFFFLSLFLSATFSVCWLMFLFLFLLSLLRLHYCRFVDSVRGYARIYLYSMQCIYLWKFQHVALWHLVDDMSKGPDGELGVLCSALQRPRRPGGGPGPQPSFGKVCLVCLFIWISLVWSHTMGCNMLQSVSRDRPFPLEWVAAVVFDRSESISCPAAKLVERSVSFSVYCVVLHYRVVFFKSNCSKRRRGSRSKEKSGHYFFSIHPSHCYVSAQETCWIVMLRGIKTLMSWNVYEPTT